MPVIAEELRVMATSSGLAADGRLRDLPAVDDVRERAAARELPQFAGGVSEVVLLRSAWSCSA